MSLKERLNDISVHKLCTSSAGKKAVHEKSEFERVVERKPREQDLNAYLCNMKTPENYPVDKPLNIVLTISRLDSLERFVRRIQKSHQITQKIGTETEKQKQRCEKYSHTRYP